MNNMMKTAIAMLVVFAMAASCVALSDNGADAAEGDVAEVNGAGYSSLQEAIDAAGSGDIIKILKDVTMTTSTKIDADRDVIIDLAGRNVTYSVGSSTAIVLTGELTIIDTTAVKDPVVGDDWDVKYDSGLLTSTGAIISVRSGGSFVLESGTLKTETTKAAAVYSMGNTVPGGEKEESTVTVNGGYIISREFSLSPQGNGAKAVMNGGVMQAGDNAVIGGNGTKNATTDCGGVTIQMTGGTLIGKISTSGYLACGIYMPNDDAVEVTGGRILVENGAGIFTRAGNTIISDVMVETKGSITGKVGDASTIATCSAIVLDQRAGYPGAEGDWKITIDSGSFSSECGNPVYELLESGEESKISVIGGNYSHDVSVFIDEDEYSCKLINNRYYVSVPVESTTGSTVESDSTEALIPEAGASVTVELKQSESIVVIESNSGTIGNVFISIVEDDTPTIAGADVTFSIDIIVDVEKSFIATITLPVEVPYGMDAIVSSYDDDGNWIEDHEVIDTSNGKIVFRTSHNSTYSASFVKSVTPSNPGFDDEDDEYPFIPGQNQSSGKDDTTTYIAVAAAAAVVAVLAVLVMAMNKGKL